MKTHYQSLGIGRDASAAQIRDAYQQELEALALAQQFATNNELKIRRMVLQQAYRTLSSPLRRQQYDAGLTGGRSASKRIAHRAQLRTAVLSILIVGILALAAYVIRQREVERASALPQRVQQPQQLAVPAAGSAYRASSQAWRKSEGRRMKLVEEMRANNGSRSLRLAWPRRPGIRQAGAGSMRMAIPPGKSCAVSRSGIDFSPA